MLKRLLENKRVALALSLLAALSLVVFAGALNHLSFRPAKPLYRAAPDAQTGGVSLAKVIEALEQIPLWKQIAALALFLLLVALAFFLLSPEARKRLIRMFIRGALALLAVYYLLKTNPNLLNEIFPQFGRESGEANPSALDAVSPPVFHPPQVSDTISFLTSLGIALAVAAAAWAAYRFLKRETHPPVKLDDLAGAARASLRELSQPGASRDAIIRCYQTMSEAVFARRGLQRHYAMTASEFARQLQEAGLPAEPSLRLTRLFESARYSPRPSSQKEIEEAVLCLRQIVEFIGGK